MPPMEHVEAGLSVEDETAGVTLRSKTLGTVKLALDLSGEPRPLALVEAEVEKLELEATLARAELALAHAEMRAAEALAEAITARDEARDRAATYAEELKALKDDRAAQAQQLAAANAATAVEREERLAAL